MNLLRLDEKLLSFREPTLTQSHVNRGELGYLLLLTHLP